jgi:sucrose-6-phosphate hydrolase SacC (GH32 family)
MAKLGVRAAHAAIQLPIQHQPGADAGANCDQDESRCALPAAGIIRLHIFVDRASIEVFGNDGLVTITDQIFPDSDSLGVEAFADGGQVLLKSLEIYKLKPAKFLAIPTR